MARYRIDYVGSAPGAGLLVAQLREDGVEVEWGREHRPAHRLLAPDERRDLASDTEEHTVGMVVAGSLAAINHAVSVYKQQFPKAKVDVDEDDGD